MLEHHGILIRVQIRGHGDADLVEIVNARPVLRQVEGKFAGGLVVAGAIRTGIHGHMAHGLVIPFGKME